MTPRWRLGLMVLAVAGCQGLLGKLDNGSSVDGAGGGPTGDSCTDARRSFAVKIFSHAMRSCQACHLPEGAAGSAKAKFQIVNAYAPNFIDSNLAMLRDYVKLEAGGQPLLLLKPLGQLGHAGGAVLAEDSDDFKTLQTFVKTLKDDRQPPCPSDSTLSVTLASPAETFRKAALQLAGRLPLESEQAAVVTEESLEQAIVKLTQEEAFYQRLMEMWGDELGTHIGLSAEAVTSYGHADEFINRMSPTFSEEKRALLGASLTQEPLRRIAYVVRNDKPFTEVVSGNYLVANPYTAKAYGLMHEKAMVPTHFEQWMAVVGPPIQSTDRNANPYQDSVKSVVAVAQAGVLTTPAFLYRWPTLPSNQSRLRAAKVLKTFLATDALSLSHSAIDLPALRTVRNPAQGALQCQVCHRVLDEVAGGFRGFSESTERNNATRFVPEDAWHSELPPPGLNGVQMPGERYQDAAAWLGERIAKDERFGLAVAQVMFRGLIGEAPLLFPQEPDDPAFEQRATAFLVQRDWLSATAKAFAVNQFNLRGLVAAIIQSPYFRAKRATEARAGLQDSLGEGRALSPELLARKYRAVTGLNFFTSSFIRADSTRPEGSWANPLVEDPAWRSLFGGGDFGAPVAQPGLFSPARFSANVYTAASVACHAASYDLTKSASERRLFPLVELGTTPFRIRTSMDEALQPLPDNEKKIRSNLQALVFRVLGERPAVDSDEISELYTYFSEVWKALEARQLEKGDNVSLSAGGCVTAFDYEKPVRFEVQNGQLAAVPTPLRARAMGAPYQAGMLLDVDDTFVIRSWQAVLTALLTDFRFTHE